MNNPLGVSPSNGNQEPHEIKKKIFLTSVGIEPTTSGIDLPLLCRLRSYEVGQRKSGTIKVCLRPRSSTHKKHSFVRSNCKHSYFIVMSTGEQYSPDNFPRSPLFLFVVNTSPTFTSERQRWYSLWRCILYSVQPLPGRLS